MDLKPVSINSGMSGGVPLERHREQKPDPEPEPEPEYEEDSSPIYHHYDPPPPPQYIPVPTPTQSKGLFEEEKTIYIGLFVCFVLGFFMGKTLQPIIIRPT